MTKLLLIIFIIILILLFIMGVLFVLVTIKMKNINKRIYKYREVKNLKSKNVLVIYQKSTHKTTNKILDIVLEELDKTDYGYFAHSLTKEKEDYSKYEYVIFISPVYFQTINDYFLNKVPKDNKFLMIYCGMKEEIPEDEEIKKRRDKPYKKIKLLFETMDNVRDFIKGEVR